MTIPSGYGEKYRAQFTAMSITGVETDPGGVFYIRLFRRGFNGIVTELQASRPAFKLAGSMDDLYGINPRRATITLISSTDIPLTEFYASNERDMLVIVEIKPLHNAPSGGYKFPYPYGATKNTFSPVFVGWLTPYQAKQPFQGGKFAITLSATCGLGSLKDFEYDYLPSLTTIHDILYNCLVKCGYELPFWIASQIFEESHLQNGQLPNLEFNPLANIKVNTQGFVRNGKRINCFDVLNRIISSNYILLQDRGVWKLQRREHLIDFPGQLSYVVYKDPTDINPVVITEDIRRNVYKTHNVKPLSGSSEGIEAAIETISLTASYGELVNQLRNGYFTSGFLSWQISTGVGPLAGSIPPPLLVGDGSDENPFGVQIPGNAYDAVKVFKKSVQAFNYLSYYFSLVQTVNISRVTKTIAFADPNVTSQEWNVQDQYVSLSIDYINRNCAGPLAILKVVTSKGTFYLNKNGQWVKDITTAPLQQDNTYRDTYNNTLQAKPTLGETFTITATEPVPGLGPYTLTLYLYQGIALPEPRSNAVIEYRRAWLTIDDRATIIATKEVVTVSPINLDTRLRQRKEEVNIELIDQTSWHGGAGLRYNAMLRVDATPTLRWITFLNGNLIRDKWQNLVAKGRIRLQGSLGRTYEGDTIGEFGPLDLMRFVEIDNRLFIPVRWEWDAANRQITVRARELLNVTSNLKLKGQWESHDGIVFPMPQESTDFSNVDPQKPAVVLPTRSMGIMTALQNSIGLLVPNTAMQVPKDYVSTSKVVTSIRNSLTNAIIRYGGK